MSWNHRVDFCSRLMLSLYVIGCHTKWGSVDYVFYVWIAGEI
jgi:hypothetical protein